MSWPCGERALGRPPSELDRSWPEIEAELHRLAAAQMRHERGSSTLQATALVHEAYLRLSEQSSFDVHDHERFLSLAATAIRNILVDHARARAARREREQFTFETDEPITEGPAARAIDLLMLDDALHQLARLSERQARLVELRYFGGLSVDDTARVLGVSPRTVDSEWAVARAWLARALRGDRRV